jgi:hypothetical protein
VSFAFHHGDIVEHLHDAWRDDADKKDRVHAANPSRPQCGQRAVREGLNNNKVSGSPYISASCLPRREQSIVALQESTRSMSCSTWNCKKQLVTVCRRPKQSLTGFLQTRGASPSSLVVLGPPKSSGSGNRLGLARRNFGAE